MRLRPSGTGRYEDLRDNGKCVALSDQETRTEVEALAGKVRIGG